VTLEKELELPDLCTVPKSGSWLVLFLFCAGTSDWQECCIHESHYLNLFELQCRYLTVTLQNTDFTTRIPYTKRNGTVRGNDVLPYFSVAAERYEESWGYEHSTSAHCCARYCPALARHQLWHRICYVMWCTDTSRRPHKAAPNIPSLFSFQPAPAPALNVNIIRSFQASTAVTCRGATYPRKWHVTRPQHGHLGISLGQLVAGRQGGWQLVGVTGRWQTQST
jgi:hypothetical protein